MSKAGRSSLAGNEKVPGPGQYKLKGFVDELFEKIENLKGKSNSDDDPNYKGD